jgi:hypothetical protein
MDKIYKCTLELLIQFTYQVLVPVKYMQHFMSKCFEKSIICYKVVWQNCFCIHMQTSTVTMCKIISFGCQSVRIGV